MTVLGNISEYFNWICFQFVLQSSDLHTDEKAIYECITTGKGKEVLTCHILKSSSDGFHLPLSSLNYDSAVSQGPTEQLLPIPGEAKAKAMPGRLYIHTK